ncbi:MAG: type II toxin-antitoxin system RelE/ParE family toxin [Defluviitaleaceae bacterium]|nr:type II toxin-antitoxin system RelE/ParE family toxin [Defluviitaleaceae bacterium]
MEVKYYKPAQKFLRGQDKKTALRIHQAVNELPDRKIGRLQGNHRPPLSYTRVGDLRIIFHLEGSVIHVLRIDSRGDVYKGL